ncbi:hypothetical protein J6590_035937 [Homalodisca vitripennis]|nr:hypothetical protein J6590_035937 [Homalodisca vitripennis]
MVVALLGSKSRGRVPTENIPTPRPPTMYSNIGIISASEVARLVMLTALSAVAHYAKHPAVFRMLTASSGDWLYYVSRDPAAALREDGTVKWNWMVARATRVEWDQVIRPPIPRVGVGHPTLPHLSTTHRIAATDLEVAAVSFICSFWQLYCSTGSHKQPVLCGCRGRANAAYKEC